MLAADESNSVMPHSSRQAPTPAMTTVLARVRSEYLEMPGLKLTEAQAQRLWALDGRTCRTVLATLVARGFLKRSPSGYYIRVSD